MNGDDRVERLVGGPVHPFDLLDSEEVAALLGLTPGTFRVFRSRGNNSRVNEMPPPLRMISGRPVWSRHEVVAWLHGRPTTAHLST